MVVYYICSVWKREQSRHNFCPYRWVRLCSQYSVYRVGLLAMCASGRLDFVPWGRIRRPCRATCNIVVQFRFHSKHSFRTDVYFKHVNTLRLMCLVPIEKKKKRSVFVCVCAFGVVKLSSKSPAFLIMYLSSSALSPNALWSVSQWTTYKKKWYWKIE